MCEIFRTLSFLHGISSEKVAQGLHKNKKATSREEPLMPLFVDIPGDGVEGQGNTIDFIV
jgi:hypothetical protein